MRFDNRAQGGRRLGLRLLRYRDEDVVVVGLSDGGMPVAYEVARTLGAPLDVVVVRKVAGPDQPGVALGALAEDGCMFLNLHIIERSGIHVHQLRGLIEAETAELDRKVAVYRAVKPEISVTGRTAILTDDALLTGATARAAIDAIKRRGPDKIVLAAPVASRDLVEAFREIVSDVVCVETPPFVSSTMEWYAEAGEVTEEENVRLFQEAVDERLARARAPAVPRFNHTPPPRQVDGTRTPQRRRETRSSRAEPTTPGSVEFSRRDLLNT